MIRKIVIALFKGEHENMVKEVLLESRLMVQGVRKAGNMQN